MSNVARDGGPAFPLPAHDVFGDKHPLQPGMSLREWFAGNIVGHIMAIHAFTGAKEIVPSVVAEQAYEVADALVELNPLDNVRAEAPHLLRALALILAEPYGCAFCDSGKLRNPERGHADDCGFGVARAAVARAQRKAQP